MKGDNNMSELFAKLNDLKQVFQFGEKVIPIIQNLIEFMREIVPLLEKINTSIFESTSKIPQVSDQINNVTSATELATTEILDLVDKITGNISKVENNFKQLLDNYENENKLFAELKSQLNGNAKAKELVEKIEKVKSNNELNTINSMLSVINEDTYKITLSLQVQDITAQQLAAVNHLIKSVHTRLIGLVTQIQHTEIKEGFHHIETEVEERLHFDANANYLDSDGKQAKVDEIINSQYSQTSQEEIDKLFK